MRKLVGQDKDKETAYQLLVWAKQIWLGKINLFSAKVNNY